jgi:hypothetical protein
MKHSKRINGIKAIINNIVMRWKPIFLMEQTNTKTTEAGFYRRCK